VARDANNIGLILLNKGDLDGALRCTERALAISEGVHGADHPNTRKSRGNLLRIRQLIALIKKG
jgi:hypothetical protein